MSVMRHNLIMYILNQCASSVCEPPALLNSLYISSCCCYHSDCTPPQALKASGEVVMKHHLPMDLCVRKLKV